MNDRLVLYLQKRFIFPLIVVTLLLAGCSFMMKNDENEVLMNQDHDLKEISLAQTTVYNKFNDDFFLTFKDSNELDLWAEAFHTAKREKVELEAVNYDILLTDDEGGQYLLQGYIGEEGEQSVFFYIGHENKRFVSSTEMTKKLREIIFR